MASETQLPPAAAPDTDSVVVYSTNALEEREITVTERAPKPKPPPIDVTAAQQYQQPDNKTPTTVQPQTPGSSAYKSKLDKEKKIGHRRVDEEGQITYKKIQTSQIIGSIQLGIGYAVGSLASKPERDLLMQDFAMVESIFFPGEGSNLTPAHHYSDFKFKAYAPVAFRYFRDLFSIKTEDFLMSLCHEPMRELTNPGASGSVFYLTNDDEFIVKTVQHKEAEFFAESTSRLLHELEPEPTNTAAQVLWPLLLPMWRQECACCANEQPASLGGAHAPEVRPEGLHLQAKSEQARAQQALADLQGPRLSRAPS